MLDFGINDTLLLPYTFTSISTLRVISLSILTLKPHDGVVVVKRLRHAVHMRRRCEDHEEVEDLVRAAPDVKGAGITPLRPASSVQERAKDVHCAVQDYPAQAHAVLHFRPAVHGQAVDDGHDA